MHHQDFSGDSSGSRKMSNPITYHHRRGSSGASASSATGSGGYVPTEENQPPPLSTNQAGSSSPGPHQHPQSLNVTPQSQTVVKKKSGFQITSVTPAQVSVSTNNSIADDTESYDDMDESHTEDLSSSDMLDVSISRATDTGLPERSSSDETLNSLHGVETPGIVSPNEPLLSHSVPQASQQLGALVNGTTHHHHHQHSHDPLHVKNHQHGHQHETKEAVPPPVSAPGGLSSAGGTSHAQRTPLVDNTGGLAPQPVTIVTVGAGAEKHLPGIVNQIVTHANVVSGSGVPSSLGPVALDSAEQGTATGAGGLPGGTGSSSSSQAGVAGGSVVQPVTTTTHPQTQAAPGSRFRVVKLDSNSEPFRKGRWMCTEYYEKEVLPAASDPAPAPRAGEVLPTEGEAAGMVAGVGLAAVPQTLQPYQQQTQDYTSPQAIQPPPLPHVGPQEAGTLLVQPGQSNMAPSATLPTAPQVISQGTVTQAQSFPYAVDTLQGQSQTAYPAPQHSQGLLTMGGQPDFIQPTAPFQTQAQGPLAPASTGVAMTGPGGGPPVAVTQPLPHQGQTPSSQAGLAQAQTQQLPAAQQQQRLLPQSHPASTPRAPLSTHGTPYMPLTTLQADLQPLLTHGMALSQPPGGSHHHGGAPHMSSISSLTATQLQDAQRLLFQHQSLVGLPRLGAPGGGERATEARGAGGGGLGQMGMVGDASALVAAAAGLRTQPADEEEDSSSGASVVAIDNKIEQAMDLVKSHLMYAVREEVEVLKEQIKELIERNSQLEQENTLLKTLASPEQMAQFQAQVGPGSPTSNGQPPASGTTQGLPSPQSSSSSA